jgi:hypothetical protein
MQTDGKKFDILVPKELFAGGFFVGTFFARRILRLGFLSLGRFGRFPGEKFFAGW